MAASYGSAVAAAMRSGNYVAAGGDAPAAYADLNETSRQDQARHAALLRRARFSASTRLSLIHI